MKHTVTYSLALLGLLLITLAGCKKEVIEGPAEPTEPGPALTELPGTIDFNRRSFDAHTFGDQFLIQTENTSMRFDGSGAFVHAFDHFDRRAADAVSSQLRARVHPFSLAISPIRGPFFSNFPGFVLGFDTLGTDIDIPFSSIEYPNRSSCLSDDNHFLLPFLKTGDERLWFAVAELFYPAEPEVLFAPELRTLHTFPLDVTGSGYARRGITMYPVNEGFLITLGTQENRNTYLIGYDGNYESVLGLSPNHFFHFRGELYGARNNAGNLELMTADADGRNWRTAYYIPNAFAESIRFFPAGNDLYANARSSGQLSILTDLNDDTITFAALDAHVVMNRTITDIAYYQGNTYVTTLSGTFLQETVSLRESRAE